MATSPDTPGVLRAIQTICQGLQVGSAPAFAASSVNIGYFTDVTAYVPCCEITVATNETERARYAVGGKIDDSKDFLVEITAGLVGTAGIEVTTAQLVDAFEKQFNSLARLNNTANVQHSSLQNPGVWRYSFRNGQRWRCYQNKVHVRYEYSVTITP